MEELTKFSSVASFGFTILQGVKGSQVKARKLFSQKIFTQVLPFGQILDSSLFQTLMPK
jgi:hypothetical protein